MSNQQGGKPPGYPPNQGWGAPPQPGAQGPAPSPYAPRAPQPGPYPQPRPGAAYPQPHPGAAYPQPQPGAAYPQPQPGAPYPQPGAPYPQPLPAPYGAGGPAHPRPPSNVPFPPPPRPPPPPPPEAMLSRALSRAFRLRIEPNEVTPNEHAALMHASPPITDPHLMAFLAWRRSLLFLVAIALVPLTLLRFYDAFKNPEFEKISFLFFIPAAAEGALCIVCWYQLKNWMNWRRQRRTLFRAWLIFMVAPFVVFLIPVESIAREMARESGNPQGATLIQIAVAVFALLTLAPKAVSLLAGTIRAAIVTKMLFPGTAGPGWLVVLATPIYALFAFTLLIVPYQATGNGWFFGAMMALAAGQLILARSGYALAKPTTHEDAVQLVGKARALYLLAMIAFGGCLVAALGTHVERIGVSLIVTTVLSYQTNVLILSLIGSDLMITNLERARGLTSGTAHLAEESNQRLSAFVGET